MTGIRISPRRERGATTHHGLDRILDPVGGALRSLWWFVDVERWLIPPAWYASAEVDEEGLVWRDPRGIAFEACFVSQPVESISVRVARPGFLPDFADIVSADWSYLCGMSFDPTTRPGLASCCAANDRWFARPRHPSVSVVIRGIDAAYWELFAADPAVLETVSRQLADVRGIQVAEFEER